MDERRRASQRQEKAGARRHGGRLQAGSGCGRLQKGDVRTDDALLEYKTVIGGQRQITLRLADLRQVEHDAVVSGRIPVLGVQMGGRDYVVLTAEDWEESRL